YTMLRSRGNLASADPCSGAVRWLHFECLEKRSQALQACNLTRNIQADGAPMVHPALGDQYLQGSFCRHRTPEPCLKKRTYIPGQTLGVRFDLGAGAVDISSSNGRSMSPMHLSGTLQRRFMKIKERSEKVGAGSF